MSFSPPSRPECVTEAESSLALVESRRIKRREEDTHAKLLGGGGPLMTKGSRSTPIVFPRLLNAEHTQTSSDRESLSIVKTFSVHVGFGTLSRPGGSSQRGT